MWNGYHELCSANSSRVKPRVDRVDWIHWSAFLRTKYQRELKVNQCKVDRVCWTCCLESGPGTVSSTLSSSFHRTHAVPLQPADYAHTEQHATHLHSLTLHTEPAAAAAAEPSWSSGPAARVAVFAVGAIRDPVRQRRLSPASCSFITQKRGLRSGLSVHTPLPELKHSQESATGRRGVLFFLFFFGAVAPPGCCLSTRSSPWQAGFSWMKLAFAPEAPAQPVIEREGGSKQNSTEGMTRDPGKIKKKT